MNTLNMKRIAAFLLLAVAAVSASEIGREDATGTVRVLRVATGNDLTVFVRAESPTATAVQVTAVVSGPNRRLITKIEPLAAGDKTVKMTFATHGDRVTELRVVELIYLTAQSVRIDD